MVVSVIMPSIMELIQQHPQWEAIAKIHHELSTHGFQVVLTGGCVRDALLGQRAHDLDLATDARPEDIEKIFPKTLMVGKQFGVSIVLFPNCQIEIATFREDGAYLDGRHPVGICYSDIHADARRRDFTVNALFFDLKTHQVLDYVGGIEDLNKKILRAVGDPWGRFKEDHLRLLRGIRFAAQLEFEIESQTWEAICELQGLIGTVSGERICEELLKFLKCAKYKDIWALLGSGLMGTLFPDVQKMSNGGLEDWARWFENPLPSWTSRRQEILAWVKFYFLFFQEGFSYSEILDRRPYSKAVKNQIKSTFDWVETKAEILSFSLGQRIQFLNTETLIYFKQVLFWRNAPGDFEVLKQVFQEQQSWRGGALEFFAWLDSEATSLNLPAPLLTGRDIIEFVQGKKVGFILNRVYWLQLEGKIKDRLEAFQWIEKQDLSSEGT